MGLTFKKQVKIPVEGQTFPINSLIRITVEEPSLTGSTAGCLGWHWEMVTSSKVRRLVSPEIPPSHRKSCQKGRINDKGGACGTSFSSVTQLCPTLCEPMDCSTPGFPVHHQLLELTQTHVHQVSDAIQPSHPLSSPSPSALSLSQHQGVFQWVSFFASGGQSIGVSASASVLLVNIQDCFSLGWTRLISLQSKKLSRVFSNTTVQKHRFFGAQLSL